MNLSFFWYVTATMRTTVAVKKIIAPCLDMHHGEAFILHANTGLFDAYSQAD